jgi:hypothetical protein
VTVLVSELKFNLARNVPSASRTMKTTAHTWLVSRSRSREQLILC